MRFVLFGTPPGPVLDILPQLSFRPNGNGGWEVSGDPRVLSLSEGWGLLRRDRRSHAARPAERVAVVGRDGVAVLDRALRAALPAYLRLLGGSLAYLREAYQGTSPALRQGITWEEVADTLAVGWLMDLAVGFVARESGYIEPFQDWYVLAYDDTAANATDCGVRLRQGSRGTLGELWVSGSRRWRPIALNLSAEDIDGLLSLSPIRPSPAGASRIDRAVLGRLCYFGIAQCAEHGCATSVPTFSEGDCDALLEPILDTARGILAELMGGLARVGAGQEVDDDPTALTFLRMALTRALSEVYSRGILARAPSVALPAWGLWLVEGQRHSGLFNPLESLGRPSADDALRI